jgi:hypothetical protein
MTDWSVIYKSIAAQVKPKIALGGPPPPVLEEVLFGTAGLLI